MLNPSLLIRDKYVYDIIDIQFSGLYYYHITAKCRNILFDSFIRIFALSLKEINEKVNLLGHK
jgi:hypothetical protein